jgi:hypothetical protein
MSANPPELRRRVRAGATPLAPARIDICAAQIEAP